MEPTNTQRAEALLHIVLRISAIITDRNVPTDLMLSDLKINAVTAYRTDDGWTLRLHAKPDDGADVLPILSSGSGGSWRAAMDDALADYADRLLRAAKIRNDWAEEAGEVTR